jgi:hypothetical protein
VRWFQKTPDPASKPRYCTETLARFMTIKGMTPSCTLPNDGHYRHDDQINLVRWDSPATMYFQNIEVY